MHFCQETSIARDSINFDTFLNYNRVRCPLRFGSEIEIYILKQLIEKQHAYMLCWPSSLLASGFSNFYLAICGLGNLSPPTMWYLRMFVWHVPVRTRPIDWLLFTSKERGVECGSLEICVCYGISSLVHRLKTPSISVSGGFVPRSVLITHICLYVGTSEVPAFHISATRHHPTSRVWSQKRADMRPTSHRQNACAVIGALCFV